MSPLQVAQVGPHEGRCSSPEPSFTYPSGSPVNVPPPGSTNRAPAKRDAPFPKPSNYLSNFQLNAASPPRFSNGAPTETPVSRASFYTSTDISPCSQKSPVRETPPCSPTRSLWREMLRLQSQWFIHSFISVNNPQLGALPRNGGKHTVTVHADGRPTYNGVWRGSPKRIVYDSVITAPVPCSLQHTFHLGLGTPEPRLTACVIVTLNRVSPPHLLPPPT
jgi:hypothetical protein